MAKPAPQQSDLLYGMKEIRQYLGGRSESTVLKMHREYALPIFQKEAAGVWMASRSRIDEWSRMMAAA